jgi:diadenosine tetraphosphate (Ap4A) HIT family hydrolase
MLMMVDPDVHFHVIPRYPSRSRSKACRSPTPAGPVRRRSAQPTATDAAGNAALTERLKTLWPAP